LKSIKLIIIALCMLASIKEVSAQRGQFGLGVMVGEPTGISAKLWVSNTTAIDFGIGWSLGVFVSDTDYNGNGRSHLHFDYLINAYNLFGDTDQYPLYCGVGVSYNMGGKHDNLLAMRFVGGFAWMPNETPLDFFIEMALVPTFNFSSQSEFTIDAGLGVRYYF
jgi:hypothetical protein